MRSTLYTSLVAMMLVLSGCATLSESQCIASDWQTVGYRDGQAGTPTSQLLKHQNACVKHGVVPDREQYLAGWLEGVEQYCQADNGFTVGAAGASYNNVCPDHLKHDFYAAYEDGRQLHRAQAEINRLSRNVAQKEQRIKQIQVDLAAAETSLVTDQTTPSQRLELINRTKSLAEERGKLESDVQKLRVQIALKSERLDSLRNALAYADY